MFLPRDNSELIRFNSNMVQLRVVILKPGGLLKQCFNSNMVQLRETGKSEHKKQRYVSIPIWFN